MNSTGLQAIIPILPTPNVTESIDFYVQKMGFQDVTPPQEDGSGGFFDPNRVGIIVYQNLR